MSDISDMMYEQGFQDGYQKALSELKPRHETIVKAADDMYAELKERRWIPVGERTPKEKDGKVLVCMPDKFPHNQNQPFPGCEVSQRVTTGKYSEFSKRWYIGDMCGVGGDDPIAWMPLPEPPMMD